MNRKNLIGELRKSITVNDNTVVNVESSHCYTSFPAFLTEVQRILRPGGTLHFADLRDGDLAVAEMKKSLQSCCLDIVEGEES